MECETHETQTVEGKTLEGIISSIFLVIVIVIMFIEILLRYIFGGSLIWSEEASRYIFIWFVYISMSYAVNGKAHIYIDSVQRVIPEKFRVYTGQLGLLIWIVFAGVMFYFTLNYTISILNKDTYSAATKLPMWIVYLGIPMGFLLSICRLVGEFIRGVKRAKT